MSTDLALREDAASTELAWVAKLKAAAELAQAVADTEFVPRALRSKVPAITAAILAGDELGLPPMQSLARIAVIDGRTSVAAETLRALVLARGHELWVSESTSTRVTFVGRRAGSQQTSEVTWTMDDAKRAGLGGKPSYRAYPRQMLAARASAELCRLLFADVVGGLAALEELTDDGVVASNGDEPAQDTSTQRRSRRSRAASTPEDETSPAADEPQTSAPVVEQPDEPERPPLPDDDPRDTALDELQREFPGATLVDEAKADAADAPPLSDQQRRKMHALFRDHDVTSREARLAYVTHVAGRAIASSNELTLDEAGRVIDALEQWDMEDPQSRPFPPDVQQPFPAPFDIPL